MYYVYVIETCFYRKGGGRSASHVLAAQGGELWIGALGGRTPYDDPPALSEGAGGRVTDYRYHRNSSSFPSFLSIVRLIKTNNKM